MAPVLEVDIDALNADGGRLVLMRHRSAQYLLEEDNEDFKILLQILSDAHDGWRSVTTDFGPRGKLPIAFQSVLACEPGAVEGLTRRLNYADATFTRL